MSKVSESQQRATDKWKQEHKDRNNYIGKRGTTKSFIRDTNGKNSQQPEYIDDLLEINKLLKNKLESLNIDKL